jgi:hypothetical protein
MVLSVVKRGFSVVPQLNKTITGTVPHYLPAEAHTLVEYIWSLIDEIHHHHHHPQLNDCSQGYVHK